MKDLYKLQEKLVPISKTNDDSYSNDSFTFSSPTLRGEELSNAIPGSGVKSDWFIFRIFMVIEAVIENFNFLNFFQLDQ